MTSAPGPLLILRGKCGAFQHPVRPLWAFWDVGENQVQSLEVSDIGDAASPPFLLTFMSNGFPDPYCQRVSWVDEPHCGLERQTSLNW